MEETDDGLELFFSGFASDPCVVKSIDDDLGSEEGVLDVNHGKQVENSLLDHSTMKVEDGMKTIGGSIAERRAAKLGFNAAKISSNPRFRSSTLLPYSPGIRSPYLTVPPGISPTALLNSPIMISNLQPSPTTGISARPHVDEGNEMLISSSRGEMDKGSLYSLFKPREDPIPLSCAMAVENQVNCSTSGPGQSLVAHLEHQSLTSMNLPMDVELPMQLPEEVTVDNNCPGMPQGRKNPHNLTINNKPNTLQSGHLNAVQTEDKNEAPIAPISTLKTAEDGYNWKKYGQKQVKGGEYPRSYYKCSHQNCEVKKKVEHSLDGQVVEIIYKGSHNHPKPQAASWKSTSSLSEISDANDAARRCVNVEGVLEWRNDGLERTSSTSAVTEVSDLLSTTHGKLLGVPESAGTPEFSSTVAMTGHEDDDEEDAATQGSFSLEDDGDNEPELKRRRKEACSIETNLGSRPGREPRVVVQIESDVDVLDDGYRWRKYGQKVVKGNPNPRSYYKCTNAGCTVRKHVERASHNLKCVITTYEGKHNHEVPPVKNSSHPNSGGRSFPPFGTIPEAEPHLERTMDCNAEFLRPNFLASIPFYPMKFPNLHNAMPYDNPFGLGNHYHPAHSYSSSIVPAIPLPMGFARPPIPSISNYENTRMLPSSVQQPLFVVNQLEENDVKLHPKEEHRDSLMYDTRMENTDHTNSSSSAIYDHIARSFPS